MQKLISELSRLYLLEGQQHHEQGEDGNGYFPAGHLSRSILEQHLRGGKTIALDLVTGDGLTRALVIDFYGAADGRGEQQWSKLCEVANALQEQLGLPAPAVSISGAEGYALWLSLEAPIPLALARRFLHLLRQAYFPETGHAGMGLAADAAPAATLAELPPCLHRSSGKWAAFINPGMGASFADEPGLEMPPPLAAQAAFLADLQSITVKRFGQALDILEQRHGRERTASPSALESAESVAVPASLLLRDATLEDIVRHLHGKNIEPTFRHLLAK